MTIHITQEDIDKGVSCTWGDPVALAIKRQLPKVTYIRSTLDRLTFKCRGVIVDLKQAATVSNWLFRFDSDMDVVPFDYELPVEHLA